VTDCWLWRRFVSSSGCLRHPGVRHPSLAAILGTLLPLFCAAGGDAATSADADTADAYVWLEDVHSDRAMQWVRRENAAALNVLENTPIYATLYDEALAIAESRDRLPTPEFLRGYLYDFWQDADHVRGLWRRATLDAFRRPTIRWHTVLDLDSLAKAQNKNWYWRGVGCEPAQERLCLIALSEGGEDATTVREFDLVSHVFVPGGFYLPRSKQEVAWLDSDHVLVARDWGPGSLTTSGYPFVVKVIRRGRALAGSTELFRGKPEDVGIWFKTLQDGRGHRADLILRYLSFFECEVYLVTSGTTVRLNLPLKTQVEGLIDGQVLVRLNEDWSSQGTVFKAGALVSFALQAAVSDPDNLKGDLIVAPGPRESLGDVSATAERVLVTTYENVKGRVRAYSWTAGAWSRVSIGALPNNSSIDIIATDRHSEGALIAVSGFLDPSAYWLSETRDGTLTKIMELPAQFDAHRDVVEQREATSKDGTTIPYYVVRPKDVKFNGQNPVILTAYGGFQASLTPSYSPVIGKLWLERGGLYAVANIRGGGEFGPAWHEAGLKVHRQRVYDDFAAVAEDLIARRITSPERLGIAGESNGGLLMGVEFTQRPELWNAVALRVPLLDMLRFEKLAAGASWTAEYGSTSNAAERDFLATISPYRNLRRGVRYAEPLILTRTSDDRVGPQHARKFAAKLGELGYPYLFFESLEGGHEGSADLKEQAHMTALEMTYFSRKLMY